MKILAISNQDNGITKIKLLILGFFLIILFIFIINEAGDNYLVTFFFSLVPIIFLVVFSFQAVYLVLFTTLFINLHYAGYSSAVIFTAVLLFSFLLTFKGISLNDIKNAASIPFFIYVISFLPSFYNLDESRQALPILYNLVAFIIVLYITVGTTRSFSQIKLYWSYYLFLTLLNGLFLILEAVFAQRRAFGFAGIMYVDYVGIGIVIAVINFILGNIREKTIYGLLILILSIASILTQTRNTWISIGASLFTLIIFLIIKAKKINLRRRMLVISLFLSLFFIAGLYFSVSFLNPSVFERTAQTTNFEESIDETGKVENSLVTRFFIWHTAVNAFLQQPVIGIGIYSFPFVNYKYYTIPEIFFERYVFGRTPHITFLAVLTETGIIGLIGFLLFISTILVKSFRNVNLAKTNEEIKVATMMFFSLVYIFFSMFMTDAWLWGQGIILFGMILGFNMWIKKKLDRDYELNSQR